MGFQEEVLFLMEHSISCEDTFRQLDHVWEERQLKIIDIYNRGEKYVYT